MISPVTLTTHEIKIPVTIILDDRKVETEALVDSGARGASYINRTFALQQGLPLKKLPKLITLKNADGSENASGVVREYVKAIIAIEGRNMEILFLVATLNEAIILGYPWLKQENPLIDWEMQTLTWKKEEKKIRRIVADDLTGFYDTSLVISQIRGKLTEEAQETWMKTRMSHSQTISIQYFLKEKLGSYHQGQPMIIRSN